MKPYLMAAVLLFGFTFVGLTVCPDPARAEAAAFLVADLETEPEAFGTNPGSFAVADGRLYFWGRTVTTGTELFVSDGSRRGTGVATDLCPGRCGATTSVFDPGLLVLDEVLFFVACRSELACGLWRFEDGELREVFRAAISEWVLWNGEVYFSTFTDLLLKSDRDGHVTLLLAPPPGDDADEYFPKQLTPAGDALFFVRGNNLELAGLVTPPPPDNGDLWRTDGTPEGTFLVADTYFPRLFPITIGDRPVLKTRRDREDEAAFYLADSTGIERFADDPFQSFSSALYAIDGVLFLQFPDGFWRTDGTPEGTALLAPRPSPEDVPDSVRLFRGLPYEGELYFVLADEPEVLRRTVDLGLPAPGLPPSEVVHVFPRPIEHLQDLDGRLLVGTGTPRYFANTLWEVEGTEARRLFGLNLGHFGEIFSYNGEIFFVRTGTLRELARYDGERVHFVTSAPRNRSSHPSKLIANGSDLFFECTQFRGWWSDGTAAGTFPLNDPALNGNYFKRQGVRGEAYFQTLETLFRLRAGGVFDPVFDFPPGETPAAEAVFAAGDARLFLTIDDEGRIDLWRIDESFTDAERLVEGLHVLISRFRDIHIGAGETHALVQIEAQVYRTDGTAAGTRQVLDLAPFGGGRLDEPAAVGGDFYFVSHSPWRLWRTKADGETVLVREWEDGALTELTAVAGRLFFAASDSHELWTSDGTPGGTVPVQDLRGVLRDPSELTAVGEHLFFIGDDGESGRELWTSDGTAAGTFLVADIKRGDAGSYLHSLTAVGDILLFAADDGVHGLEPWVASAGDDGGISSCLMQDIQPGFLPSDPGELTPADGIVYMKAGTFALGYELWAVPDDALERAARRCMLADAVARRLRAAP